MKHVGPISGVASYDDKWIATAGYDNRVILWDALSGNPVARCFHDHLSNQCAFSNSGDLLVSSSSDHTARIWSVPDLKLMAALNCHCDDVEMAVFSPDDKYVATASRDCNAYVYDVSGGCIVQLVGHDADVISVTWSSDGEQIITSSDDGTVRRWNSRSGVLLEIIDLDGVETDTVIIDSAGTIFSGDDEGFITIINGGEKRKIPAHNAGIKRLVMDSACSRMISLSYDRTSLIWEIDKGEIRNVSSTTLPNIVWPRSAAFIGEEKVVFATFGSSYASFDILADRWEVEHIEPDISINAVAIYNGDTYSVGDAGTVFKNGKPYVKLESLCNFLACFDGTLLAGGQAGVVFDVLSGSKVYQHHSPLNCGISCYLGDDQPGFVVGTYTGEGVFLSRSKGEIYCHKVVKLHENAVKGIGVLENTLFSVSANGDATFFDVAKLVHVKTIANAHERIANACVGVSNDLFVSVSRDLKVRFWKNGISEAIKTPHKFSIKCIAASREGNWIATGSYGGCVAIYDLNNRRWAKITRLTASGISSIVSCNSEGEFLASSYDGSIYQVSAE